MKTTTFLSVVQAVANQCTQTYPLASARIAKAVGIIATGGVHMRPDRSADVQSEAEVSKTYHVNGGCECPDYIHGGAPQDINGKPMCKHRLARALFVRALQTWQPIERTANPANVFHAAVVVGQHDPVHGIAHPTADPYYYSFRASDTGKVYALPSVFVVLGAAVHQVKPLTASERITAIRELHTY